MEGINEEIVRKIFEELFKLYANVKLSESIVYKFIRRHYNINDDKMIWKIIIKAEELGIIQLEWSPFKYGQILITKLNNEKRD